MTHRRRRLFAIAAVTVMISASACVSSATSAPQLDQGVVKQLDAAIDATMKTAAIPGVIVGIWRPDGD
jgi:hypothetical protein